MGRWYKKENPSCTDIQNYLPWFNPRQTFHFCIKIHRMHLSPIRDILLLLFGDRGQYAKTDRFSLETQFLRLSDIVIAIKRFSGLRLPMLYMTFSFQFNSRNWGSILSLLPVPKIRTGTVRIFFWFVNVVTWKVIKSSFIMHLINYLYFEIWA